MIAHARQAMVYVLVVALTFIGSWLLFGRESEVGVAAASPAQAAESEPLIFQAGDRTCVYAGEQLECFCSCAELSASGAAPIVVHAEPQVIAVPAWGAVPRDPLSGGAPPSPGMAETDPQALLSRVMPGFPGEPGNEPASPPEDDPDSEPDEKQKCNQGVGNGAEGCDPGNSNHNQPTNDEDGGVPGSPGRQGPREPDGESDSEKPDKND